MKTLPKYLLSKWKNRELEPMKASPDLRFDWPQGYTIATSVIFRTQVWNLILEKSWRWCGVFFGTKDKRRRRSRGEVLSGIIIGRILQCYYYPTSTNFFLLSPFLQDPIISQDFERQSNWNWPVLTWDYVVQVIQLNAQSKCVKKSSFSCHSFLRA